MAKKYVEVNAGDFMIDCSRATTLAFLTYCQKYKQRTDIVYILKNFNKFYEQFTQKKLI